MNIKVEEIACFDQVAKVIGEENAVVELQALLDYYKEKEKTNNGWIDLKESLPKRGQKIDLHNGKKRMTDFVYLSSLEVFRSETTKMDYPINKFTHWMPVPDAPNI